MVRKIFVVLLLFCVSISWAQPVNQVDSKGRKQGIWEKTYPDSRALVYRGEFKNDKPVGTFYYFYPSTKKKIIIVHDPNSVRSAAWMYHENGVLMGYGIYRNQEKDSVWTHYGPSGRLSYKETYSKGVLNGTKTIYYVPEDPNDKSARVARIENYKDGVRHGKFTEYFDYGVIKSTGNYENGKKRGKYTVNHPNGKPMIIEQYKYGNRHGWAFGYDSNGAQTGKRYYKFGREISGQELKDWLEDCKKRGVSPNN
ncbi:MAG: hypothetical protein EP338_13380 [Bacteroidetes bacterium]|nr:MAG: hypothetical protein EP338_13380 [Bacteroidota bacterium]